MAELLRQNGDLDAAEQTLRVVLELYARLKDGRGIATTQAALAGVTTAQGDGVGAERLYRTALAAAVMADDRRGAAVIRLNLAQWLHEQGHAEEALLLGWQAYGPLLELGYAQDASHAQNLLVDVRGRMGDTAFQQAWQEISDVQPPVWLA
jgi:ATP/maltotriose-dependent transcriptional regulator MalT